MESAKITIPVVMLIMLSFFVHAAQPALPTSIYGRVVFSNGTVASEILVEAAWVDNDGNSRVTTVHSLSPSEASEAGSPSYSGYYFFNKGYLQAASSSTITISSPLALNSVAIAASPGSEIQAAKDIVLPDENDKTPPVIFSVKVYSTDTMTVSFTTNELAYPEVKYGIGSPSTYEANKTLGTYHLVRMTNLVPYSDYVLQVSASDAAGNTITDDNNGKYYRFRTGSAVMEETGVIPASGSTATNSTGSGVPTAPTSTSQNSSSPSPGLSSFGDFAATAPTPGGSGIPGTGDGADSQFSDFDSSLDPIPNKLPTSIYGKISDKNGDPVEGVEVVARWSDNDGTHELTTSTLTREEAEKLGNVDLAGYYFFRKNLTLPAGTNVNITSPEVKDYEATASSVPADRTRAQTSRTETVDSLSSIPQELPEKKKIAQTIPVNEEEIKASGFSVNKGFLRGLLVFFSYVIFLLMAIFFILSFRKFFIKLKGKFHRSNESELAIAIRRDLIDKKVSKIMTRNVVAIENTEQLRDAVSLLLKRDFGSIVVMQGNKPTGLISEKSIADDVLLQGKQVTILIKDAAMEPLIQLSSDATIFEAYEKIYNAGARKAVIVDKKNLIGIVTMGDIAKEIHEFIKKHSIESDSVPDVDSVMERNYVSLQRNASLKKVAEIMKRNSSSYGFIEDESFSIITEHDLLGEIYSNGSRAAEFSAVIAAKPRVATISPSANVFEANELMNKIGFRRLAVQSQGKITGVITQEELNSSILNFLVEVTDALKKK